jgi:hypothetical protein
LVGGSVLYRPSDDRRFFKRILMDYYMDFVSSHASVGSFLRVGFGATP